MPAYDRFNSFVSSDISRYQSATCPNTTANQKLDNQMHDQSEAFTQNTFVSLILYMLLLLTPYVPNVTKDEYMTPCSPGSRWMAFGLRREKMLG